MSELCVFDFPPEHFSDALLHQSLAPEFRAFNLLLDRSSDYSCAAMKLLAPEFCASNLQLECCSDVLCSGVLGI